MSKTIVIYEEKGRLIVDNHGYVFEYPEKTRFMTREGSDFTAKLFNGSEYPPAPEPFHDPELQCDPYDHVLGKQEEDYEEDLKQSAVEHAIENEYESTDLVCDDWEGYKNSLMVDPEAVCNEDGKEY